MIHFSSLSLKQRLLLGFMTSTLIVSVVASIAWFNIAAIEGRASASKEQIVAAAERENSVRIAVNYYSDLYGDLKRMETVEELRAFDFESLEGQSDIEGDLNSSQLLSQRLRIAHERRLVFKAAIETLPAELAAKKRNHAEFVTQTLDDFSRLGESMQSKTSNESMNALRKDALRLMKTAKIARLQVSGTPDFVEFDEVWGKAVGALERFVGSPSETGQVVAIDGWRSFHDWAENRESGLYPKISDDIGFVATEIAKAPTATVNETGDLGPESNIEENAASLLLEVVENDSGSSRRAYLLDSEAIVDRLERIRVGILVHKGEVRQEHTDKLLNSINRVYDKLEQNSKSREGGLGDGYLAVDRAKEHFVEFSRIADDLYSKTNDALISLDENSLRDLKIAGAAVSELIDKKIGAMVRELVDADEAAGLVEDIARRGAEAAEELSGEEGFVERVVELQMNLVAEQTAEHEFLATLNEFASEAAKDSAYSFENLTGSLEANAVSTKMAKNALLVGCSVGLFVSLGLGVWIPKVIVRRMSGQLSALDGIACELNAATVQVESTSASLANGSSQQAAALEQTSAAVREVEGRSSSNAESTRSTAKSMNDARVTVEAGVDDLNEMESAMAKISESSGRISEIIKTIEEIAFQTNILALNAAVEAARAGEAGSGFAVVAEEVRVLAQRAAQAAQDTDEKIKEAIICSDQGVGISAKAKARLDQILDAISTADKNVVEIETATDSQHRSVSEIANTISHLDDVTQTNAASAEEAASAAKVVSSQAENLVTVVNELTVLIAGGAESEKNRKKEFDTNVSAVSLENDTFHDFSRERERSIHSDNGW